MSANLAIIISLVYLLLLLFSGVRISIVLMSTGFLGIAIFSGNINTAINLLGTTSYAAIKDYVFGVIPLFVMMGMFVSESGAGSDLYRASNVLLRKQRGGLAIATVIANAIFAAVCGASIASAAVFSKISFPEMRKYGYSKEVSSGCVAGSSVLGMLIPPSILMIVYGTLTGVSIGAMFIAGIGPGVLLSIFFIFGIIIDSFIHPDNYGSLHITQTELTEEEKRTMRKEVLTVWPIAILIIVVIGGMWGGIFTPTEAGGIGAFGALTIMIFKRKFTLERLWVVLKETGYTCGSILFILICAQMFARMLAFTGIITAINTWIINNNLSIVLVLSIFCLIQLLLGCLLDSASILLLTIPVMYPVISAMGHSLIWYGLVAIMTAEIGLLTPPFGICVYTVRSSLASLDSYGDGIALDNIFKGSRIYIVGMGICLILMIFIPQIVTYLPSLM